MSVPDPTDPTYLAVTIGRIEEGLKYVVKGFDEMKASFVTQTNLLNDHTVALSHLEAKIEAHDKIFDEAKPIKSPWPVYAALALSVIATLFGIVQAFPIGK